MLEITIKPTSKAQLDAIPALLPQLAQFLEGPAAELPQPIKKPRTPKPDLMAAPAPEVQPSPSPAGAEVSLTDLRARLAEISKNGKTDAVKALVMKYGGQKLTDVPADRYGDLLTEAEEL